MHTERTQKKPIHLGPLWSVVLLPLMFLAAGLSFPYGWVANRVRARRERRFRELMELRGRLLPWNRFTSELDAKQGTVIVERCSFKGPLRWWWTSEDVYRLCPHPIGDWFSMLIHGSFRESADWCQHRYTSADEGRALLVEGTKEQRRSVYKDFSFPDGVRWVEIVPPRPINED
jgi:hypothetical protein